MKKLIINDLTREKRFALIDGQKVEKLYIKQPKQASIVSNIYWGTVTKVLPGMNAAFVDIGEDKNGFLPREKLASYVLSSDEKSVKENRNLSSFVHEGEKMLVVVDKDATGTKGPRLSGVVEIAGDHIVYMPKGKYVSVSKKIQHPERLRRFGYEIKQEEEGLLFRTSSEEVSEQEIQQELQQLRADYQNLKRQTNTMKKPGLLYENDVFLDEIVAETQLHVHSVEVVIDHPRLKEKLQLKFPELPISYYNGKENIFDVYRLQSEIENALKRVVLLNNGAYLVIDEEEALTVIDVNTGKFSGKQDLPDTVLKTNLLAAEEAARQIRLRDIGGIILIDFIDMKSDRERNQVKDKLLACLAKDHRQTRIVGFTSLGIMQLTRKKTKVSISEALMERCPTCEGTGKIISVESTAFRLERELYEYRHRDVEVMIIESTEEVKSVFCGEQNIHQKRLEEILGFTIEFQIVKSDKAFYHIIQVH